jgi:predicted DNA-binding ribbon-helix-helix protein
VHWNFGENLNEEASVQTVITKRSIVLAGHKTSVSLEEAFWTGLKEIGRSQQLTLSELVGNINTRRLNGNLSSAIRLFVLDHYRGVRPAVGESMDTPPPNSHSRLLNDNATGVP